MKLTNTIRSLILLAAVDDKFKERRAEMLERELTISDAIFEENTTEEERKAIDLLMTRSWFNKTESVYVSANGYADYFQLRKPVPYGMGRLTTTKHMKEAVQFLVDKRKYSDDISEVRIKLNGLLDSMKSAKQLRDAWPEGAEYYEPVLKKYTRTPNLPTVRVEEINAILGLPKDAEQ